MCGLLALATAVALAVLNPTPLSADALLDAGRSHHFNQEYDEAIETFRDLVEARPEEPHARTVLAMSLLYRELHRIRALDTNAFRDDPEFYEGEKPEPDKEAAEAISAMIRRGVELCRSRLAEDPEDVEALVSCADLLGLRALFEIAIGKDYFGALAAGRGAKSASQKAAMIDPDHPDALLTAGINDYMIGSLPWALRAIAALSGVRGNKKRGLAILENIALNGADRRNHARLLLGIAYRRERRYEDAAALFSALAEEFPRAYIYPLEVAAMHKALDEPREALAVLRDVMEKRISGEDRFDRMPQRWAEALARGIEKLESKVDGGG